MIETESRSPTAVPPTTERPRAPLGAALIVGILCQLLVIAWIVYSEVPAKVFISSWSISMPGVLLLAALLLGARRAGPRLRRWLLCLRRRGGGGPIRIKPAHWWRRQELHVTSFLRRPTRSTHRFSTSTISSNTKAAA